MDQQERGPGDCPKRNPQTGRRCRWARGHLGGCGFPPAEPIELLLKIRSAQRLAAACEMTGTYEDLGRAIEHLKVDLPEVRAYCETQRGRRAMTQI